ncbi:3-dehydroquinate synthase [Virgibacillus sp. DJP39]|uniref:3-dehydroquinate synthase n=1 Tax=Virgibacillus sp. DJP39 TaxID=3409790 RepID=UPI003BB49948
MERLEVKTKTNNYPIYLGRNLLHQMNSYLAKEYSTILIITDEKVEGLYLGDMKKGLKNHPCVFHTVVPSGEKSKSIEMFYELQTKAIEYGLDRNALIIAFGGGVVGDLAGFVASTFMRGIDFIQVPTTILAHDSSVGGKVAVNHGLGKNLIGSFYPPVAVIYDIQTLQSLPANEIRSGYAEIVKEALIADQELFEDILKTKLGQLSDESLKNHIFRGIEIKKHFVEADENEKGIRAFLNFGHTLGHALESEYGYGTLSHGEAVAIGMLFAMNVSETVFSTSLPVERLQKWLNDNMYPLQLNQINIEKLIKRMKSDKKVVNNHILMVLLNGIGNPVSVKINDTDLKKYMIAFFDEER